MNGISNYDFPERLDYIVVHSLAMNSMALRYLEDQYRDQDIDYATRARMMINFQKQVMDTFEEHFVLTSCIADIADHESQDVIDLNTVRNEFRKHWDHGEVISMVPVDLDGQVALIVMPKPMSPSSKPERSNAN